MEKKFNGELMSKEEELQAMMLICGNSSARVNNLTNLIFELTLICRQEGSKAAAKKLQCQLVQTVNYTLSNHFS